MKVLKKETKRHYVLDTTDSITLNGHTLYRVVYTTSFSGARFSPIGMQGNKTVSVYVHKGMKGGYIEHVDNLRNNALCLELAKIYGNAVVRGSAIVSGKAQVGDDAIVMGHARVFGAAKIMEQAVVTGHSIIKGRVRFDFEAAAVAYFYAAKGHYEVITDTLEGLNFWENKLEGLERYLRVAEMNERRLLDDSKNEEKYLKNK